MRSPPYGVDGGARRSRGKWLHDAPRETRMTLALHPGYAATSTSDARNTRRGQGVLTAREAPRRAKQAK
ncbi:MAG TPA: hypothetical protein VFT69_17805 [Pseudolabrys sp.]|nr:hypothetical protein [Pseudolabrys sp.]